MQKKILFLVSLLWAITTIAQTTKTVKVAPNKDTVVVTSTTTTTVTTNTVLTTTIIPTIPPDPNPSPGGEIQLSFSPETNYYERPFAGVEDWNGQNYSPIPASNPQKRLDLYFRLLWTQMEGQTQGSYSWVVIDKWLNQAITNGQKLSIGIFLLCPGGCDPFNQPVNYDGASSGYPLYVHTGMQNESVKDWKTAGVWGGNLTWVPNWNSNFFLTRLEALHNALRDHINTGSFNGVPYKNVLNYIDVRIMGSWGEWHHAGIVDNMNQYPTGMRPTVATYKRIFNMYVSSFPNNQLAMLLAALDAERLNHTLTPIEVTNYALTIKNNVGFLGIRSDQRGSLQWNDGGNYVHQYMENNNKSFQGSPVFATTIMQRWKFAPLVGEPENNSDNPNLQTLVNQCRFYNQNSVGNGNYTRSNSADNSMRDAAAAMGYYLAPKSGKINYTTTRAIVSLGWQNTGLTPIYENWNVMLQVVNSSGTVVNSVSSSFKPRLFLPAPSTQTFTDTLNLPGAGSYTIKMVVVDPNGYRKPLPLHIKGRNTIDGSYTLATFTVSNTVVNN